MTLYNHIFPVEKDQYLDYALGFLYVICKAIVILLVMLLMTLLENSQGFPLVHPMLARYVMEYALLAHFQLGPFNFHNFPQD